IELQRTAGGLLDHVQIVLVMDAGERLACRRTRRDDLRAAGPPSVGDDIHHVGTLRPLGMAGRRLMFGEAHGRGDDNGHDVYSEAAYRKMLRMLQQHPARLRLALLVSLAGVLVSALATDSRLNSQAQETHAERAARFRRMSIDADTRGLAAPFKGITTN